MRVGDGEMMESEKPGGTESCSALRRAHTGLRDFVSSCQFVLDFSRETLCKNPGGCVGTQSCSMPDGGTTVVLSRE